jgi:hypothetical protein
VEVIRRRRENQAESRHRHQKKRAAAGMADATIMTMNTIVHPDAVVVIPLDVVVLHREEKAAVVEDEVLIDGRLFLTDRQLRAPFREALRLYVMSSQILQLSAMRQQKPLVLLVTRLPKFPLPFIVKSRDSLAQN